MWNAWKKTLSYIKPRQFISIIKICENKIITDLSKSCSLVDRLDLLLYKYSSTGGEMYCEQLHAVTNNPACICRELIYLITLNINRQKQLCVIFSSFY